MEFRYCLWYQVYYLSFEIVLYVYGSITVIIYISVLKSCHEYMVAGLTGVKNESVDPDILDSFQNQTVQECNLDLGKYSVYYKVNDSCFN